jgi:hypothetical protein
MKMTVFRGMINFLKRVFKLGKAEIPFDCLLCGCVFTIPDYNPEHWYVNGDFRMPRLCFECSAATGLPVSGEGLNSYRKPFSESERTRYGKFLDNV